MFSHSFVCPQEGGWLPNKHHRSLDQHRGWSASRAFCIRGGLYQWGGLTLPPELENRSVRILLECFLVFVLFIRYVLYKESFEIDQLKDTVLADLSLVSIHSCVNSIVCAVQT